MAKTKWFTSSRKLDSLPVGALVSFSEDATFGTKWRKVEQREDTSFWTETGNSYTDLHPYSSKSVLAYNGNRQFQVVSDGR